MSSNTELIKQLSEAQGKARAAAEREDSADAAKWNATARRLLAEIKKSPGGLVALRSAKTIQHD